MNHNIVIFRGKEFKAVKDTSIGGDCASCAFDIPTHFNGCGIGDCSAWERGDQVEAIYKPHYNAKRCAKTIKQKIVG